MTAIITALMQISTKIDEKDLPERFRQVFEIVPIDDWRRRAADLVDRERQNPHLSAYFDQRYTIERLLDRALEHCSQRGTLPPVQGPDGGRYHPLYSFIHVLGSVYPRLSTRGQYRVCGYLRDGLQSKIGLAAFAHELAVAAHLWSQSFDVTFTDIDERARFDFLPIKDGLHLEVDCKTASGDVGRKIHRIRALELFHHIPFETLLKPDTGRIVDIVLPDALNGRESYMDGIASIVSDVINQNRSLSVAKIADVSLREFAFHEEPSLFLNAPTLGALERIAERLGRGNEHVAWFAVPEQRTAAIVFVSSRRPDKVADGIYRALKKSAEEQFSGKNPALLAINILDLTPTQLQKLASGTSALQTISNHLFEGDRRKHLFGVSFVSPAQQVDIYGATPGTALSFIRTDHPLSRDPCLALFNSSWRSRPFWIARVDM
jgi:hypothetical protein